MRHPQRFWTLYKLCRQQRVGARTKGSAYRISYYLLTFSEVDIQECYIVRFFITSKLIRDWLISSKARGFEDTNYFDASDDDI